MPRARRTFSIGDAWERPSRRCRRSNPISAALTGEGEPARLAGKAVTSDYFRVFATQARLGRTFLPEDDQPGAAAVVVLSHAAWQRYFGGDPDILSRRPILDGEARQVIGVLPPGAFDRDRAEFWKPLALADAQQERGYHWLTVYGRIAKGATLAQAREQMQAIDAALEELEAGLQTRLDDHRRAAAGGCWSATT